MRKHISLVVLLFCTCVAFAQEHDTLLPDPRDRMPDRKFLFALEGGLEREYRSMHTNDSYYASPYNFTNADKRYPGKDFHIGISLYRFYNNKWFIETGAHYFPNNYSVTKFNLPFLYHDSLTHQDTIIHRNVGFNYQQAYLYFPFHIKNVIAQKGRATFYVSAGTGCLLLLFNNDLADQDSGRLGSYNIRYKRLAMSWYAGVGLLYKIDKELKLKIEPGIRSNLTPLVAAPDRMRMLNPMISVGLIYTQ